MRRWIPVVLAMLLGLTACNKNQETGEKAAQEPTEKAEKEDPHKQFKTVAKQVADQWLKMADGGDWGATWDNASRTFKQAIPKPDWETKAKSVRDPLGPVLERHHVVARYETELPGAPDGDYVVLQYRTRFENKAHSVETISVVKEDDGMWRVTGYFIK